MNVTPSILAFFTPPARALIEKYDRLLRDGILPYEDVIAGGKYKTPQYIQDYIYRKLVETYPYFNDVPLDDIRYYFKEWLTHTQGQLTEQDEEYASDCLDIISSLLVTFYGNATLNVTNRKTTRGYDTFAFPTSATPYQDQTQAFAAEATLWTIVIILVNYLRNRGYPDYRESLWDCFHDIEEYIINRPDYTEGGLAWLEETQGHSKGTPGIIPRLDQLDYEYRIYGNPEIWGRPHTASLPASTGSYTGGGSGGGASSSSSSTRAGAARYLAAHRREGIKRRRTSPYGAQWAQVHKKRLLGKRLVQRL